MTGRVKVAIAAALAAVGATWPAAAEQSVAILPLEIDAAEIQLIPAYAPSPNPTAEQNLARTPQDAFMSWAREGLRPLGSRNRVVVIVRDASIVETPVEGATKDAAEWRSRQPARRFGGAMAVEVRVHNIYGTMVGQMKVRASADATVYEGGTPTQHMAALRAVRRALVDRIARALHAGFQTELAAFLLQNSRKRPSSGVGGGPALSAESAD